MRCREPLECANTLHTPRHCVNTRIVLITHALLCGCRMDASPGCMLGFASLFSHFLTPLGIMGDKLRSLLKPLGVQYYLDTRGVSCGASYLSSHDAETPKSLGRLYAWLGTHWKNSYSISFHIEWDMIVVTVFLSIFWTK